MSSSSALGFRSHLTLALCAVLHLFTHAYGVILVPLYLMIVADLHLPGVKAAALVVTIYSLVYSLLSTVSGGLADRFDRKWLLGIGLLGNALAVTLMGLTRSYEWLVVYAVLGGIFGMLFHPTANALAPAHYPKSPGMAIGLLGIGSGLGFFVGPKYSGWRAETATWHWRTVADWQRPCIELGLAGIVCGLIFLIFASEARARPLPSAARQPHKPLPRLLRNRVLRLACALACRDFAGVATLSLAGIYLQKAHGLSVQRTGAIVGAIFLPSVILNPLAVYLSPGKRRLPALLAVLLSAGAVMMFVPFLKWQIGIFVLAAFQTLQMTSYAISDAAMLERVPAELRGRVVGMFLTIAGTASAMGPWVMGWWTDLLGSRANLPSAYLGPFALNAGLITIAAVSTPLIAKLGEPQLPAIDPLTETMPSTMEPAG